MNAPTQPHAPKRRGRPIRGAIAGLLFGLFVSLDLVIFGVVALDADILALFPVLGLAAGIALGITAPLHRRGAAADAEVPSGSADSPRPVPTAKADPTSA